MTEQTAPAPSWLDGFVDILQARRRTWIVAAVAVVLLGALLALLAPTLLPPTLLMGVAVGIAAALLATAIVVALDSADLVVRGPRHVIAAGGQVAGTISRAPGDIDALMDLIDQYAGDGGVRVALTPASRSAGVPGARANMVAEELAHRDLKVLCTDLTRGRTPAVGLSDVLSGDRKLAEAVRFDEELFLAHLAIGSEPEAALAGFADWANALPEDLDVLVAALPPLAEPGVLPAVQGVELVLVLVEVDRTERVDLIACLDAIDAAGVPAALVLVDPDMDSMAPPSSTSVAVIGHAPDDDDPTESWTEPTAAPGVAESAANPAPANSTVDVLPGDGHMDDDEGADSDGDVIGRGDPDGDDTVRVVGMGVEPTSPSRDRRVAAARSDTGSSPTAPGPGARGAATVAGAAAAGAAAAGAVAHARSRDEPDDEYEDDDDAVPPVPGGGHVRTVRPRRPAEQSEPAPAAPDSAESTPAEPETASRPPEAQPAPARPEPARPEPEQAQPEPASPAPSQPTAAPAADSSPPTSGDASGPDGGDEDDIDATAREAARLTASLQSLANEVWQRGDG